MARSVAQRFSVPKAVRRSSADEKRDALEAAIHKVRDTLPEGSVDPKDWETLSRAVVMVSSSILIGNFSFADEQERLITAALRDLEGRVKPAETVQSRETARAATVEVAAKTAARTESSPPKSPGKTNGSSPKSNDLSLSPKITPDDQAQRIIDRRTLRIRGLMGEIEWIEMGKKGVRGKMSREERIRLLNTEEQSKILGKLGDISVQIELIRRQYVVRMENTTRPVQEHRRDLAALVELDDTAKTISKLIEDRRARFEVEFMAETKAGIDTTSK